MTVNRIAHVQGAQPEITKGKQVTVWFDDDKDDLAKRAPLTASIRVTADSCEQAHAMLAECLLGADANFGAWPDGEPLLGEAHMVGNPEIFEIDGESTDG